MHRYIISTAKRSEKIFKPILSFLPIKKDKIEDLRYSEWVSFLISIFIFFSLYAVITIYFFTSSIQLSLLLGCAASYLVMNVISFLPQRRADALVDALENSTPAGLDMLVAQYRAKGSLLESFRELGQSDMSPLNKYFSELYAELKSGMGIKPAFSKILSLKSHYLRRVSSLMMLSLEKGVDVSNELLRIAEDMIEERHIKNRKKILVSKDVLLLGIVFCAIVPFIYSLSIGILQLFSSIAATSKIVEIPVLKYVLLFSIPVHAYFVSLIMGELLKDRSKEGLVYFPLLTIVPITIFFLSEGVLNWLYGI